MLKFVFCFLFLLLPICSEASTINTIAGTPRVIDGDTLEVDGHKIRLLCIDTPESNYRGKTQYCLDNETDCGEAAKQALIRLIDNKDVLCNIYQLDMYGRDLGICYSKDKLRITDKASLNYQLLNLGFAYYYPCKQHKDWKTVQTDAMANQVGLFDDQVGGFKEPKLWRKTKTNN